MIEKKEIIRELEEIDSSHKPPKYEIQLDYPYNDLNARTFELLIYSLFNSKPKLWLDKYNYDKCFIMNGVGEKGRDILIAKNNSSTGIVQCKKYKKNLDITTVLKEIIKFSLYSLSDKNLIPDIKNFSYILAISTGLSNDATDYIANFNKKILKDDKVKNLTIGVIKDYKSIQFNYKEISGSLKNILSKLRIEIVSPIDITVQLKQSNSLVKTFFKTETTLTSESFEGIINGKNLNVPNFLELYKKGLLNNYSRINFFGLDIPYRPREVNLYDLFVEPHIHKKESREILKYFTQSFLKSKNKIVDLIFDKNNTEIFSGKITPQVFIRDYLVTNNNSDVFLPNDNLKADYYDILSFRNIYSSNSNIVILGKPGSGKSSLVKYSICKIIDRDFEVFTEKDLFDKIPFRIEINKYAKQKKEKLVSLVSYLAELIKIEFQLNFINPNNLERLFSNYSTIVFFDGLDEIFDVQERIAVRNDIENFVSNHALVQAIVTSRFESYTEVSLSEDKFEVIEVMDFDDTQINKYVNNWYSLEEKNKQVREREISGCLAELQKVNDELKRIPLFLSLILLIYRNELELPTSKLDLYESCTKTLVETRDKKEKKLDIQLKISNKIATFANLAFWQFEKLSAKNDHLINYNLIKNNIKSYLLKKGEILEDHIAEQAADEFLEFARIRSIYVENNFSHKTFLEYFTAYYIYTNFHQKGDFKGRDALISKYLGQSFWAIVIELLICKIDREQADYEVLDNIIQQQLKNSRLIALNFFVKILPYLKNISPSMVEYIVKNILIHVIDSINKNTSNFLIELNSNLFQLLKFEKYKTSLKECLYELYKAKVKNVDKINYSIFYKENILLSKNQAELFEECEAPTNVVENPYLFILKNYSSIYDPKEFHSLIENFISRFGKKSIIESYQSKLGYSLFLGLTEINLIVLLLFNMYDYNSFLKNYGFLKNCGLNDNLIRKAINNSNSKIALSREELLNYYSNTKDNQVKELLENALFEFYKFIFTRTEHVIPFYKKRELRGRRFPKPK